MTHPSKVSVIKLRCKICGRFHMYSSDSNPPERCARCGHAYNQAVAFHVHSGNANVTGYRYIRWGCRDCAHHGTTWLKRNNRLGTCPHCNAENRGQIYTEVINSSGDCDTIWQPMDGVTRPKIKTSFPKLRKSCDSCGYIQEYVIRHSITCPDCGNSW